MPAYVIIDTDVRDKERYEQYKRLAEKVVHAHGGTYVARGGAHELVEGDWRPTRLVLLQFPDVASARACFASPEYQAARQHRVGAAGFDAVILEGLDKPF